MKQLILSLLIFLLTYGTSLAQGGATYELTLDECIEVAKGKSLRMLRLEQSLRQAEFNLQAVNRSLKTHIDLSLTLPNYSKDVREKNDAPGSYYSVEQIRYSGNLNIVQPLPTDGEIYIANNLLSLDDRQINRRSSDARTNIGLTQPLDAFYGYNNVKSTLKRAKLAHEQSSKSLKREELNLVYDVSRSYYNLLSLQESAAIALLDLERQAEAQDISKNKFAAGLIREVDALQMEVDLAEAQNNYDIALLNMSSALNSFKELLGVDLDDNISIKKNLDYVKIIIDPELAVKYALDNRLEIREKDIQYELQELNIKQQKAAGMVKANVNANYGNLGLDQPLFDSNGNPLEPRKGIFSSIGDAYGNYSDRPANFSFGFTLKVPILDWGENRSKVRAAKAQLQEIDYSRESTKREIETEVINLVASINSNLKRLQLLEKNVSVAEKSFEITRQRYTDGDIDSQALALERNRLNNAYTSRLSAYINYQLSLADLMRKTFYDFQKQSLIE